MQENCIIQGDSLKILKEITEKSVDLVYLDPLFLLKKNNLCLPRLM